MSEKLGLLSGRMAVVTGGSSGIGRGVCIAFAREGARVMIADLNMDGAMETLKLMKDSTNHLAMHVDVSKSASVNQFFSELKKIGAPDILVNCAGIATPSTIIEMTEDAFDHVIAVNLKGTFLMTQGAVKQMIEAGVSHGSVVNISSIATETNTPTMSIYTASKCGVNGFTHVAAKELAQYGIRCNAILPGVIDTPLTRIFPDERLKEIADKTPLQRLGKPEEIAETCVFLSSEKSSFTTGSLVQVTGGWM